MNDLQLSALPKVKGQADFTDYYFEQMQQWKLFGLKLALVTVVNIEGSSPRPLGSQLLVNEKGEHLGLLSGGCFEAAAALEALSCIKNDSVKLIRYGKGSPYFDIQLPCGSGIDLLIQPLANSQWVWNLHRHMQNREPCQWQFRWPGHNKVVKFDVDSNPLNPARTQLKNGKVEAFAKVFSPKPRIVVIGSGVVFECFMQLGSNMDYELFGFSETEGKTALQSVLQNASASSQTTKWTGSLLDRWTSLVLITHDHDYEIPILQLASTSSVGFVCALGSKKTHKRRLQALKELGVSQTFCKKIKSPAGLDIGAKSPPEIALSILSELIANKNTRNFRRE